MNLSARNGSLGRQTNLNPDSTPRSPPCLHKQLLWPRSPPPPPAPAPAPARHQCSQALLNMKAMILKSELWQQINLDILIFLGRPLFLGGAPQDADADAAGVTFCIVAFSALYFLAKLASPLSTRPTIPSLRLVVWPTCLGAVD